MTVTAAAVHLPRFPGTPAPETTRANFRRLNEKPTPPVEEARPNTQNAAVAQAIAAARAEFDATRAADLAEYERRLAERETEILSAMGDRLAGELTAELAAIAERVGLHVGTVLLRFLDQAVRERAVSELVEAVSALLTGATATRVRIAGPAALTERVAAAIGPTGVPVECTASEAAELSVTIDDTVVETNVTAWMDRLLAEVGATDNG